jgi:hypothetical protein
MAIGLYSWFANLAWLAFGFDFGFDDTEIGRQIYDYNQPGLRGMRDDGLWLYIGVAFGASGREIDAMRHIVATAF